MTDYFREWSPGTRKNERLDPGIISRYKEGWQIIYRNYLQLQGYMTGYIQEVSPGTRKDERLYPGPSPGTRKDERLYPGSISRYKEGWKIMSRNYLQVQGNITYHIQELSTCKRKDNFCIQKLFLEEVSAMPAILIMLKKTILLFLGVFNFC